MCLIQQIGLYKELLSQVTYQNQLLSRDITFKQQQNHLNSLNQLKYPHNELQFNAQGINYMTGINPQMTMSGMPAVSNLQNLQNLSNLAGLSGMGSNMMGSNLAFNSDNMLNNQVSLNNLINQNRNAENSKEKEGGSAAIGKDAGMSMLGGMGGMASMGGLNLNNLGAMGGMSNMGSMASMGSMNGMPGLGSNYDIIKNMVLEEMKQEAEREKQENSK